MAKQSYTVYSSYGHPATDVTSWTFDSLSKAKSEFTRKAVSVVHDREAYVSLTRDTSANGGTVLASKSRLDTRIEFSADFYGKPKA